MKKYFLLFIILVFIIVAAIKLLLGGGKRYPDISTDPIVPTGRITKPIEVPFPPGMVAAAPDGRIFYTYHMLYKPERFTDATVFEWVNGKGVPFPNLEMQSEFEGAMGITIDHQRRFWIVIPGGLKGQRTRLIAIDLDSRKTVIDHYFAEDEAEGAQDMRVSNFFQFNYLCSRG